VFGLGPATRIYLAAGVTDMRKRFEGLYGLVRDRLSCEPLSGHLFLFCNGRRNRLKVLVWDGSGLWVCAKRLEKRRFTWPQSGDAQGKVVLSHEELSLLLGGIDLTKTKHKRWYRGRDGPKRFLGQFEGILQTDGYAAYDQIGGPGMVHAACWAHARRQFFEAVQLNPRDPVATPIVARMNELLLSTPKLAARR
jgi:transposase